VLNWGNSLQARQGLMCAWPRLESRPMRVERLGGSARQDAASSPAPAILVEHAIGCRVLVKGHVRVPFRWPYPSAVCSARSAAVLGTLLLCAQIISLCHLISTACIMNRLELV
jgi:hypothetical protein